MATEKFLNLHGLSGVAEYVNSKLRIVTTMPASPELDDIVLYNGSASASYKQGCIYRYETIETYYKWSDTTDDYYTKSATPTVGDIVYSDTSGTDSGYTIEAYDSLNNQVTINSLTYDRDSTGDTPVNNWILKGGSSVILNGVDKTGDVANFYAPTASGSEGQVLVSNGGNTSPSWATFTGYSPTVINDTLCFYYGAAPEVDGTTFILDI